MCFLWIYIIWVEQYSVTLTNIYRSYVISELRSCEGSASGRKPFWFHHLLKYESTGFIAKRAAIHLFRCCSIGSCYWLLSLHPLTLHPSRSSIVLPIPSLSPRHLNVVMLSWQLKCFLSACWVNWLSQKCFLPFSLPPANMHTHSHAFFLYLWGA